MEVSHAMEAYIDEMTESKDWENTVLAKTNLLHEAAKYMAEEMGRVPTIEELSEYTKITRDEIKDIMGLSEDAKRVASPE
jgi:DNA-directed RNA polymerase specialized sigma subunit